MEYAKYTQQDVLTMEIDVAKAFDSVQWDYIAAIMKALGFESKLQNIIYWLYQDSIAGG